MRGGSNVKLGPIVSSDDNPASKVIIPPEPPIRKIHVSKIFVSSLSIISIIGFVGILSKSFFDHDITDYIEAVLMFIIGVALLAEAKIKRLRYLSRGLNSTNFTRLITVLIGLVALTAGIFSYPSIRFDSPVFLAVKGILAFIAIAIIVIQTWIIGD